MKKLNLLVLLLFLFVSAEAAIVHRRDSLDAPLSPKVSEVVKTGVHLVEEQDKVVEGLAKLKEAVTLAPNSVKVHSEYIRVKSYWLNLEPQVTAEYEELMKKEPNNPVYPAALAIGQSFLPPDVRKQWFQKVVELAPDSVWGRYAKAQLLTPTEPEAALAAYLYAVEKDPTEKNFYAFAFPILLKQKKYDEYESLLVKMKQQTDLRSLTFRYEWDLQVVRLGGGDDAKKQLSNQLKTLIRDSGDVKLLIAARNRFLVMKDDETANLVAEKIVELDPTWFPDRGQVKYSLSFSDKAIANYYAGRQVQILEKLLAIASDISPQEQIAQAELLISPGRQDFTQVSIYRRIFELATKNNDARRAIKYGELLLKDSPEDIWTLSSLAKIFAAEKKNLSKADADTRKALDLTKEFRLTTEVPLSIPPAMFKVMMSEAKQKNFYKNNRKMALDARGAVLTAISKSAEAETVLQESLKFKPAAETYALLEKVYKKMGRAADAEKAAADAEAFWRNEVVAGFTNEPIKDFELFNIKGEKVRLSDLKGKLVMMNFWATWCGPCVKEMPVLIELYDQYKSRGLEILAVSGDQPEDKTKVASFAVKSKLNFPVLYGEQVPSMYNVNTYPTTIFVDRKGNIKYRLSGIDGENVKRNLEFLISELMKSEL